MDLSSLYTTLASPPGQLQQAEIDMMEKFKAAALSITNLYKSSVHTSKHAYSAGYGACLNDIQQILEASLSGPSASSHTQYNNPERLRQLAQDQDASTAGRTLARLMDWIEARQEAMKLEAEDEKEEEQREADAAREREESKRRQMKKADMSGANTPVGVVSAAASGSLPSNDTSRETEGIYTAPPSANIRQRDALVKAVELARSRSRSASAQAIPFSNSTPTTTAPHQEVTGLTASQTEPVMNTVSSPIAISSPAAPSSPVTTFSTRPLKPYPLHHQKSFNRVNNMKAPTLHSQFKPSLPETMPFFPLFQTAASMDSFDGMGHNPSEPVAVNAEQGIGGKRSHESVFGGTTGLNSFSARHNPGRRRGNNGGDRESTRHHPSKGIFGGMDGADPSSEDDRQRKRQSRR
ncbi:hypothetical protein NliqN6_5063 [Naganishia liquefaciens]|uniref:Uncharacterized protein n=1 Tax=Naganishia liquefaciens TaxID=104408 RepID=A0A8H3YIJ9_9TREE|nr:hypothetical protein NliqN6_5063 [Naganishia liquefaciens]